MGTANDEAKETRADVDEDEDSEEDDVAESSAEEGDAEDEEGGEDSDPVPWTKQLAESIKDLVKEREGSLKALARKFGKESSSSLSHWLCGRNLGGQRANPPIARQLTQWYLDNGGEVATVDSGTKLPLITCSRCEKPNVARGLCRYHYDLNRRTAISTARGSPTNRKHASASIPMMETPTERMSAAERDTRSSQTQKKRKLRSVVSSRPIYRG
jgi:hypothetical protein